mgnify:CR=1 FL=1
MIKQRFKRCKQGITASVFTFIACNIAAQETNFNQLVIFGDSLFDTGNRTDIGTSIKFTNRKPDGTGFAKIAPEHFAEYLNLELTPAVTGGTNYAVGGYQTADILESVTGNPAGTSSGGLRVPGGGAGSVERSPYLTENSGVINPGTLILIDGGGNDIVDILQNNPGSANTLIPAAAQNLITSAGALHTAGADYIMLANLPDLGANALGRAADLNTPGSAAAFSAATSNYNDAIATLTSRGLSNANIIPVDLNGAVNHILSNAQSYGLANGEINIGGGMMFDQRYMCYDGSNGFCVEHPVFGLSQPGRDPQRLFFNDYLHPTKMAGEIVGDYLIDIITAPTKVGLLPTLGLAATRTQITVAGNELRHSRWHRAESRLFITGDISSEAYKTGLHSETDSKSLTAGKTFTASETLVYGGAVTVSRQTLDIDKADFNADAWGLTGMLGYRQNGVFIDSLFGFSVLSYDDLKRDVQLGSQVFSAKGDTDGHAWTVDALAGFDILSSDSWHLAPAIGVRYINTTVDGYTESGGKISNYKWGKQRHKSLQWRYGVVTSGELSETLSVFGEVFKSREQKDSARQLSVRNTNLDFPSYQLPGYKADGDSFTTLNLGGVLLIPGDASLNLTYSYSDRNDDYEQIMFSYSIPM